MQVDRDLLFATLDSTAPDSAPYSAAVAMLRDLADSGDLEAGEELAEICATPGPNHNPSDAYLWYHIVLSRQGYTTAFLDCNGSPPYYRGPVGDFRNESMVSDLVATLGYEHVQRLDQVARSWTPREV